MAKGDIYANKESINDAAFMTIQPAAGQECELYNIGWTCSGINEGKIEVYRSDASTDDKIADCNSYIALSYGYAIFPFNPPTLINNADYIKVKNVSGASARIWYDGVERKPAT
jgi:hypothetical protein